MKIFEKISSQLQNGNGRSDIVKKNIVGSLLIKGFSILISLVLVPLTLGYVSSELYGIWLTLSSIMLWLSFFDVGFTLGLKNKLAEAIAINEWEKGKSLVSTTYFMMIILFIPFCFILEVVIPFIDWSAFLNVDAKYNEEITKALYVLAGCFCLQMIVNVLTAVVAAFQKVAMSSLFSVIGNALSVIAIWVLTKTCSPSLVNLAFSISTMPVIVFIIASIVLYSRSFKRVAPSVGAIQKKYIRDLFGLGYKFFLIQVQVVVLYQTTNVLISNVSGPNEVTFYNIAYKYLGIAMMIYTIILNPLWPAFTDSYAKGDFQWMNSIYKKMSKIYVLSVFVMFLMVVVSPFIYRVWVGDSVKIPMYMTIAVFIYMTIHSWDSLQVNMINGIGAIKLQTYVVLIGLIIHIPMSLLLGKWLGALGVIVSMILINIIYSSVFTIQLHKILTKSANGIWLK